MADNERFDDSIGKWLEETAPSRLPQRVLEATFERTRRTRQETAWRTVLERLQMPRLIPALGGAAVVVVTAAVLVLNIGLITGPGGDPSPTPAASPTAAASPSPDRLSKCTDSFRPEPGTATVLGCSRDGRLLIQKGGENLFVRNADGSETQVTDQLSGFSEVLVSGRPLGATISPDGSRVVFAGLTKTPEEAVFCHDGALFAVDSDGGPTELLWESHLPNGIVSYPTFSPDGTQIAFADGNCDSDHSVWVMNPDGSGAQQIVSSDMGPLSATHVRGLAWSAAGDRIALKTTSGTYTFAKDGSDFTEGADWSEFCWPGLRC